MDYIIKNKIVSLGASSTVRDAQGNDLFIVRGRFFTFTKKKIIMDLAKKPLYQVRNKFFHIFLPKVFVCDAEGKILLMIKKKSFFSLRNDFEVLNADKTLSNYTFEGNFMAWSFVIKQAGLPIAEVHRNFNIVKDSFVLSTSLTDQAPFLIALVIAFDNWCDKLNDSHR
ncbi:MAG: LURP-one-related family protein [Clostridia bacterium]|nr:LURP-one-related family protein [Clostridia bacterium]